MKKVISLLMLTALLLGICGCTTPEPEQEQPQSSYVEGEFNIGFAMLDISPKESLPLQGYGATMNRMANDVEYSLKATALAITGADGNTVILIETDMCTVKGSWLTTIRTMLSQRAGIPESQIYVGASHTHAAPDTAHTSLESMANYINFLVQTCVQAGVDAMQDRKPAKMYAGSVETQSMNFVRNYFNVAEDGTLIPWGDNYGHDQSANETTRHATDADPTMYVIKFTRENERDLLLVNFRAHPHLDNGSGTYAVSADYVGAFRETVDVQLDCDFMFLQGASGNVNTFSKINGEARTDECPEYGLIMTGYTRQVLETMTEVEPGNVKTSQILLECEINHSMDSMAPKASEISALWNTSRDLDTALAMGKPLGIRSPFHANAVVNRSRMGSTGTVELNVITVGEHFAIATAPMELFDTLGSMIEEQSPYDVVLVMGYTGDHVGYMPSAFAFEYTSYETDICRYVAGTGEKVVDAIVETMKTHKNGG